jgi:EAL domain-containing protein (putative c-di-GMP-specific phosphodiesterase class I)/ActR/RegA family two-component response regulator
MSYRQALVVDDDPVFRALAEDMLFDAGVAQVASAEDGKDALARINTGRPVDFLICDLNMPAHDGVSLIRLLAEQRFQGRVLIVSGESNPVIESVTKLARMQGLDIVGSVRKPLTMSVLLAALASTERARPIDAAPAPATPSLLTAAIERGALHPFFQAKVSMKDRRICGAEALARIAETPTLMASPEPYVELAERNNRIDDLTIAMAGAVAKHARGFHINGAQLPVSINISPLSLNRLDFPDLLADVIQRAGVPCTQVTLEVTETRLLEYGANALDVLARLRLKGFGLSVDDFGTGYSNIDRLRMYPFTELKIDQSFTRGAFVDKFARACVESSVHLARELGLKVVAEGVETEAMWSLLASLGVDEAQGFLMARPMPPGEFARLLALGLPPFNGKRSA